MFEYCSKSMSNDCPGNFDIVLRWSCAKRAAGRAHGSNEISDGLVIFYAGLAFYPAANVDRVGRHRRNRSINILSVQSAGENQKPRVTRCSSRSGPIARLPCAAPKHGVVRIDEHIAMWECCCAFWLKSRVSRESANHAKFSS